MALPSTIRRFELEISDVDAGVYETLSLRVAQHPSETDTFLLCRVLANCLHLGDGAVMSKAGLCEADEPALIAKDLTGQILLWLDVGTPAAERLHKASKRAARVVVYTHKRPELLLDKLRGERIHRVEDLELYGLDPAMLATLSGVLERVNHWSVLRNDGLLFITAGDCNLTCAVQRLALD